MNDLRQKYTEAIEYLDDNFAFFLTHVLNMGEPVWTDTVPTACVALPKDIKDISQFKYLFSPRFANEVLQDSEELAFVMAHETMHVLLNHLKLAQKFDDKQKFNIAADCVINDYLVSMGLTAPDKLMFGEKVVGYNCSNATVSEVYADVPDQPQDGGTCDGNCQGSQGGQPGSGTCTCPPDKFQSIDDHDWMHNPNPGQAEAADQIAKDTEQNAGLPQDVQDTKADDARKSNLGSPAGDGVGGLKDWSKQKNVGLKWAELLKKVNPDMFKRGGPKPRPSYRKPRRKMMGVLAQNPDVNLPIFEQKSRLKGGDLPCIVMALDTSGSCAHYADDFISLAKSVPADMVKVIACTFTTSYMALDLENPNYRGGGTEFGCIEKFVQNEVKGQLKGQYPKAVVVVTDGAASFSSAHVDAKNKDKWTWLITDWQSNRNYYVDGIKQAGFKSIEDLSKYSEGIDKSKP